MNFGYDSHIYGTCQDLNRHLQRFYLYTSSDRPPHSFEFVSLTMAKLTAATLLLLACALFAGAAGEQMISDTSLLSCVGSRGFSLHKLHRNLSANRHIRAW